MIRALYGLVAIASLELLLLAALILSQRLSIGTAEMLFAKHGLAMIAIPVSALLALIIVTIFRALEGPILIEFLGAKGSGAVAACLLWIAIFSTLIVAIRTLW